MAMRITQFLLSAQSTDAKVRMEAEANLKLFQEQNLSGFLLTLSTELWSNDKPIESRRLAGIVLKNSLDAKDAVTKEHLSRQWMSIDVSVKSQIKEMLLKTLDSSSPEARHISAQIVAKIAKHEIPQKSWPELIGALLVNMTWQDRPTTTKQALLVTLGYVCEEISHNDLGQDEVNSVLTAIVQGMNIAERCPEVRLSATKALYNALNFAQSNFENEIERNYIMKMVCETAMSQEAEIRQAAYECLVSIASTYYHVLEPYMETLFELTSNAVKRDEEAVALQATEFWSSICDKEIDLQDYEANDHGDSACHYFHFIEKALTYLVPMLLATLLKQKEDQDQDNSVWTLSMAGGNCLCLVARTVGDAVVPLVMPFVEVNILNPDWHYREAATYAFGSILEGPSVENITPFVHAGLEFLLNALKDENSHVKDTTAWTLCRIFELLQYSVLSAAKLQKVVEVLLESIHDTPNIAEKVCGTLYYIAQGYEHTETSSSVLSDYLPNLISVLVTTADRTDSSDGSKLRSSAYETLNEVIRWANFSKMSHIATQLLLAFMHRLGDTLNLKIISSNDREKQAELQAHLCSFLQLAIQKLSSSDDTRWIILKSADELMILFLMVFACRSTTVHEEAMLAVGSLASTIGPEFEKYMPEFYKYLAMGLHNFREYQGCAITVGVIGDISRALEDKILAYCDGIMGYLITDLSSGELHRSVKPPIFSCFGDIALAIGVHFEKYLSITISMMHSAVQMCAQINSNDEEMIDYGNQLRNGILEGYSGILLGLKDKPDLVLPLAEPLLQFVKLVFGEKKRDGSVTKAAVAVIGDLAGSLNSNMKFLFTEHAFYHEFLRECLESDDEQLKETASWTYEMIRIILLS